MLDGDDDMALENCSCLIWKYSLKNTSLNIAVLRTRYTYNFYIYMNSHENEICCARNEMKGDALILRREVFISRLVANIDVIIEISLVLEISSLSKVYALREPH